MSKVMAMDLSELLGRVGSSSSSKPDPKDVKLPMAEAQVMELMAMVADYGKARERFKVGDLVTPKKLSYLRGHGVPHVVAEIYDEPKRYWAEQSASSETGVLLDIRLFTYADADNIVAYSGESYLYETWVDPEVTER